MAYIVSIDNRIATDLKLVKSFFFFLNRTKLKTCFTTMLTNVGNLSRDAMTLLANKGMWAFFHE